MAQVVLLHSAIGLTPGTLEWVERLREEGHTVHAPDLFDGRVFDSIEAGVELVDSVGLLGWVEKAAAATAHVEGPRVYAGFSMGAAVGEVLAFRDAQAQAAIIMHGALSPEWVGVTEWPAGLRAQLHYAIGDPWNEADENAAFLALAGDRCEVFEYPGSGHLFALKGWEEYDAASDEAMFDRVTDLLAEIDNEE